MYIFSLLSAIPYLVLYASQRYTNVNMVIEIQPRLWKEDIRGKKKRVSSGLLNLYEIEEG